MHIWVPLVSQKWTIKEHWLDESKSKTSHAMTLFLVKKEDVRILSVLSLYLMWRVCLEHSPTSRMYCNNHWNHETVSETMYLKKNNGGTAQIHHHLLLLEKKTFVLGTLLNLNPVGCPTKKCHCLHATELWWAYGTLEGLSSSKWIESSKATPLNSFSFTFTCFVLFTYYNTITVLPFLYNMMHFLLGLFYKLGCIISCWFFPISWLLNWCLCMGWYYSMWPDPWHL